MEGRKIEDVNVLRELVQLLGWAETGNGRWIHEHGDMSKNVSWDEVVAAEQKRIAKFVDIWEAVTTGASFPVVARSVLGEPYGSREIPSATAPVERPGEPRLRNELLSYIGMLENRLSRLERGETGKPKCTCDDPGDSPCLVHHRENQLQDRAIKADNALRELSANYDAVETALATEIEKNQRLETELEALRRDCQATEAALADEVKVAKEVDAKAYGDRLAIDTLTEKCAKIEKRNEVLDRALSAASLEFRTRLQRLSKTINGWLEQSSFGTGNGEKGQ